METPYFAPWPGAGHLGLPGSHHQANRSALKEHAARHQQLAEVRNQVTDGLITPHHGPRWRYADEPKYDSL